MESITAVGKIFTQMARLPEAEIDLARAALVISRIEYPALDESVYLARIESLAERVINRIAASGSETIVEAINRILFVEEGFRGNIDNYYDPRNSCLNQVLDRKLGIPITLSLVYILVGRGAGLDLHGVNLPGHFITGFQTGKEKILIDPFNRGNIISVQNCRQMVLERFSGSMVFQEDFLNPAGPKTILSRLLRNLKGIYTVMNEELKAFQMIQWILELDPHASTELRDRGLIYEAMGDFRRAVRDLERYLDLSPGARDVEMIKGKIESLQEMTPLIH